MKRYLSAAVPLMLVAAACSSGPKATAVTVETTEYGFVAPATFAGGLVELTLDNSSGKESHEAEMVMLEAGKTKQDYIDSMEQQGPPPTWMTAAIGPGPVEPGQSAVYTANVAPGTYLFVCHVPAPDGQAHLEKGMIAEFTVTEGTDGTLPAADATITATEFAFAGTDDLEAGEHTVAFVNDGEQDHHVAVFAMAEGKKTKDLTDFFGAREPAGPPPFTGLPGLMATTPPDGEAVRTMELTEGTTYVLICFIPDTDGTPHAFKGMTAEVTV